MHPTRRRTRTRRARRGCPAIAVAGIAPAVGDRGEANGRIARTERDARVVDSVQSTRATTSGMAPAIRGTARCRRPRSLGGEDRQRQSISEPGLREELLQLCGIGPAQSLPDHTAIGARRAEQHRRADRIGAKRTSAARWLSAWSAPMVAGRSSRSSLSTARARRRARRRARTDEVLPLVAGYSPDDGPSDLPFELHAQAWTSAQQGASPTKATPGPMHRPVSERRQRGLAGPSGPPWPGRDGGAARHPDPRWCSSSSASATGK